MSLFENWVLSLLCSFLSACCHGEVGWGWKLCPPLCQHFWTCQLPAPAPDGGAQSPLGTDPFSASRFPWGKGDALLHALTQQLDPECLRVLGIVPGLSVQRRRAGAQASPGRTVCPITPSLPVPLLHVIPTSEFQGLSLFLLQPWYLLIWNLHSRTSFPLPAAPSTGPGQRRALTQDPSVVKSFLWRLRMSVCPVFLSLI